MKLTYFQLEPHLSKQLAPIYIISGEDLLLKQDALNWIRKAAKKAGINARIRLSPDAEELHVQLNSRSLLAEKRLFELDCRDSTPNKAVAKILQEYAEQPLSEDVLLIEMGKIDDKIAKSAWYKTLEKNNIVVTIWPIPREQLPQWILNRAKKYKLQMQPEAVTLLVDYIEGNLVAAAQAIEKIYLLQPQTSVDKNVIENILTDESRFTIFDFIDNLVMGEKARSLHILENLKADDTEPTLILWGITRELRLLAELAQQIKQGMSYENLFQQHRIFSRRQPALRRFLTHFSAEDCWRHLMHASDIDQVIKGAAVGDVWEQLQLFCLRMTTRADFPSYPATF